MWTILILTYVAGVLGTAGFVYNDKSEHQSNGTNAGMVLLWPFFWLLILLTASRGGRK